MTKIDVMRLGHAQELLEISTLEFLLELRAGLDLIQQCTHWSTRGLCWRLHGMANTPKLHAVLGMGIEGVRLSHVQIVLASNRKQFAQIGRLQTLLQRVAA